MRRATSWWIGAAALAVSLSLGGCSGNIFDGSSDDSGDEAQVEEGVEALNSEDWDEAITIFKALYEEDPNPENAKYLASAYVGKAGFDTLDLVEKIADAEEQGASDSVIYDAVTQIFADENGVIGEEELRSKEELLVLALQALVPEYVAELSKVSLGRVALRTPTADETFQAGLYAAVHAVVSVSLQLHNPDDPSELLLTLEQLQGHPEIIDTVEAPDTLDQDLALVAAARDVLIDEFAGDADKNDIAEEFDRFLLDIGFTNGTPGVSADELRAYLHFLLNSMGGGT